VHPMYRRPKNGCHGNVPYVQSIGNICILSANHSNPLHNQLPSRYRSHKASYSNLVPKLVAMATTGRHSISTVFSSDSLTLKTRSWNQTACRYIIQPKLEPIKGYRTSYGKLHPKIDCHGNVPQHLWTPI